MEASKHLQRPRKVLVRCSAAEERPRLTKLLFNVTIQGSVGPVQVIMTRDSTVGDLIATAVRQYVKEGRPPMLPTAVPSGFNLHYSQFSLESLGMDEKVMSLGSRNFFLCRRKPPVPETDGSVMTSSSASSCSKEAEKSVNAGINWLKFMDFSL
ncbi:hypothetical protein SAY87_016269 [Trapa incisa]|uniref:DUF7054 domain-containing protein n=1 Tax=Trapa incisa TaxID=236973 RepID=A0AAN7L0Z8_9MYRT|nr:hypothetical protein SAY87_016269 [Trapa incisa]